MATIASAFAVVDQIHEFRRCLPPRHVGGDADDVVIAPVALKFSRHPGPNTPITRALAAGRWPVILRRLRHRGVGGIHAVAPERRLAVVDGGEVHRHDVLAVRVERHLAGDALVAARRRSSASRILPRFSPARQIDSQQDVHRVVGERREHLGPLAEALLEALVESRPTPDRRASGRTGTPLPVPRRPRRRLRNRSSPSTRKLPKTRCFMPISRICFRIVAGRRGVAPEHDAVHARIVDDAQLRA